MVLSKLPKRPTMPKKPAKPKMPEKPKTTKVAGAPQVVWMRGALL